MIETISASKPMQDALSDLAALAEKAAQARLADSQNIDPWHINPEGFSRSVLSVVNARKHVDSCFHPWTVVWALRTDGHILHMQNRWRKPTETHSVVLETGSAYVFNAHLPHWTTNGKSPLVFLTMEYETKPSDDVIYADLQAEISEIERRRL